MSTDDEEPGGERPSARHGDRPDSIIHEMVREDRDRRGSAAGSTASADAMESVRRAIRDLKHDVRMLKVDLDKQGQVLEHVATRLDRLTDQDTRRRR